MNCQCDAFVFPEFKDIPAGLSRLPRQVGTFYDFRRAMLHAISVAPNIHDDVPSPWTDRLLTEPDNASLQQNLSALRAWRGRHPHEYGMMLIEMWAYVCDLTSFYDQVLAGEAYLGTAGRRPSLRKLVDLLGYLPKPALGALADLAVFADGRQPVKLPIGTAFRSGAFDGNPPQVFELGSEAQIHPLLNTWTIPPIKPDGSTIFAWSDPAPYHDYLLCQLGSVSVKAGDLVLLTAGASRQALNVAKVEKQNGADGQMYSRLTFAQPIHIPAGTRLGNIQISKPTASALLWSRVTDPTGAIKSNGMTLNLDSMVPSMQEGQDIILSRGSYGMAATIAEVSSGSGQLPAGNTGSVTNAGGSPVLTITPARPTIPFTIIDVAPFPQSSSETVLGAQFFQARNADGRQEIFAKGSDGALWHVWQTAPNGGWSSWKSLGSPSSNNHIGYRISVASNADGRLEVFAKGTTDGALWHNWQIAPNGAWSGWATLNGQIGDWISVASNLDGRLEAFARGTDGSLWHKWQTAPNGGWGGWASLGGQIGVQFSIASNADGRLEAFAKGTDGSLWHNWQTPPIGVWSGWASLGGQIGDQFSVAPNADGRLEAFVKGTDSALWHIRQTPQNSVWSQWTLLGGSIVDSISATLNAEGLLDVFAQGIGGSLQHIWQTAPNNGWSPWSSLGTPAWDATDTPKTRVLHSFVSAATVGMEAKALIGQGDASQLSIAALLEEPYDTQTPSRFRLADNRLFQLGDKNGLAMDLTGNLTSNSARVGRFAIDATQWAAGTTMTAPLTLFGNIIPVSRGETFAGEALGAGDASIANQRFTLAKKPLTYLPDNTPKGFHTTLNVWVDGVLWNEVPNFYGLDKDAEVYIVRQNDVQESVVTFGDGERGKRLNTNAQVTASYRHGAGLAMPPAGSITQIAKPAKGLRNVRSPIAPYKGADSEEGGSLQKHAPRTALLFGRAISMADLEAAVMQDSSVRVVASEWKWNPDRQSPTAHLWYIENNDNAQVTIDLQKRLRGMTQPGTPITVTSATKRSATLVINITTDPRRDHVVVGALVKSALTDAVNGMLIPELLGIGKPIYRSAIFETVLAVTGVVSVDALNIVAGNDALIFPSAPNGTAAQTPCVVCSKASDYAIAGTPGDYFEFADAAVTVNAVSA